MNLKGYEWLINGKVVMTFTFKRLELDVWQDVSKKEYDEFVKYIKDKGYDIHCVEQHYSNKKINKAVENKLARHLNGEI